MEKVPVTLHLTVEAANILLQYAGERNRGFFISQLLVEQRRRDDIEGQAVAAAAAAEAARNAVEAARRAQDARQLPGRGKKSRKGR